jgi:hypothetical protein
MGGQELPREVVAQRVGQEQRLAQEAARRQDAHKLLWLDHDYLLLVQALLHDPDTARPGLLVL